MKVFLRLLRLFRPYLGWMLIGVVLSFVTLLANVVLMAISGWFIAAMALAGLAGVSMNYFTPAAIIRAMAITRTGGRYLERLVTHEATFRLLSRLRVWFYEHLEPLAPAGLQHRRAGDLLSRIRADIDTLENFYLRFLVPVSVAVLAIPAFTLFLSFYSLPLAISVFFLLLTAGLIVPLVTERLGRNAAKAQVETASRLRSTLVEGQQGLAELLVYGAQQRHTDGIEKLSRELTRDQKRLSALEGVSQGAIILCANLALFAALLFIIPLVAHGKLAPALLAMLVLFSLAAFEAVMALPLAFRTLPMVRAAARRLFEVADAQPVVVETDNPLRAPISGDIEMRGIHFRYEEDGADILSDIKLSLSRGKKMAVMGPTGSGKSSLVNLLLRFWEPQKGAISIDGHPSSAYRLEDLRALFAVVPQRIHLFNTTIRANLRLGRPDADEAALQEVCRIAGLDAFILSQPDGYDTFVGEAGLKLSGGQIRRLGIARALLKDAPVLVLDEPGEGLDANLAQEVLANILGHRADQSLLLITHSLTGLGWMDEIIVLQAGRIAQRGTHEILLAQKGHYAGMHNQLGAFELLR